MAGGRNAASGSPGQFSAVAGGLTCLQPPAEQASTIADSCLELPSITSCRFRHPCQTPLCPQV
eukprot:2263381-Alexandrium_andersonii.AAC.1